MNKIHFIPLLFAPVVIAGCTSSDNTSEAVATEDEIAIVDIGFAHSMPVEHSLSYTANIEADNLNNISPSVANRIKTITVDVGDHVSRGQVLATLDESSAEQLKINLEQTEREYNRAVELLEIGAGTQRSVDQYKAQLDAQRSQYANTLENTVLRSPISGVVTTRNYDPGDMTGSQPILTVGQITPSVKVVINVNESDLQSVKNGMPVKVSLDAYPGDEFSGKITRVSPAVDITTRTFPVEITMQNTADKFRPGMFARVNISLGEVDNVVVPDRAIVKQTGSANKYVYVYSNGHVAFKQVQLGQRINDSFELLDGINDGDTVVITGQSRLADGVAVKINDKH